MNIRQVERNLIPEIPVLIAVRQFEVPAAIAYNTCVLIRFRQSRNARDRKLQQDVLGLPFVKIEYHVEFIAKQRYVESDINRFAGLPRNTLVGIGFLYGTIGSGRRSTENESRAHTHRSIGGIGTDLLITQLAPRSAQFEIRYPVDRFHEILFGNTPSERHRRENSEAVSPGKSGRPIDTNISFKQIARLIGVVRTCEIGKQSPFRRTTTIAPVCYRTGIHNGIIDQRKAFAAQRNILGFIDDLFITAENPDFMVSELLIVPQNHL